MVTSNINPRVTVLMAVYNSERYLRQAVDSILRQTFTDFEFLIINDGSTDQSRNIILSYGDPRIQLIDNPENIGLTKSLNRGLALARGELVARLDADDISHPERLEHQVEYLDRHPDSVLLGTQARVINELGKVCDAKGEFRPQSRFAIHWKFLFGNPFVHSSVMFRRTVIWNELGGYDDRFFYNQDFELWSRVSERWEVSNLPNVYVDFRSNSNSITRQRTTAASAKMKNNLALNMSVLRRNLERILQTTDFSESLPDRISRISNAPHFMAHPEDPGAVVDIIFGLYDRFIEVFPEAILDSEFRRVVADRGAVLSLYLAPQNPWAAMRMYQWSARNQLMPALLIFPKYLVSLGGFQLILIMRKLRQYLNINLNGR